jgi:cytochrome c556
MRHLLFATPLIALALSACGNPDTPAGRAADARHESFEEMGAAAKAIGDQLGAAKPDLAAIRKAADTINGMAPKIETWFPAGSGPEDGIKTDSLQTVWTKPAEFKQAADRFVAESAKFHALAQGTDIAAIGAGMKALGGSCKNCHDGFRERE